MWEILATIAIKNSGSRDIEERVETPSFIFKDSCSRGVKSMRGLYPVSSLLFCSRRKDGSVLAAGDLNRGRNDGEGNWTQRVRKWRAFTHEYERKYKQGRTQMYTHRCGEPSVLREMTRPCCRVTRGGGGTERKGRRVKEQESGHARLPFAMWLPYLSAALTPYTTRSTPYQRFPWSLGPPSPRRRVQRDSETQAPDVG